MIDTTLIDKLTELVNKEKRIKGKIIKKSTTKKGNITLTIQKREDKLKFTVLKSHKERFALAEKLTTGRSVSIVRIPKLKMNLCVSLKQLEKGIAQGKQTKLQ